MIRIITIEREYGSGGGVIAGEVAKRLGWKLWDQLLTEEIARRLDCDCHAVEEHQERRDPAYYRLLKAFMRGETPDVGLLDARRMKPIPFYPLHEPAVRMVARWYQLMDAIGQ